MIHKGSKEYEMPEESKTNCMPKGKDKKMRFTGWLVIHSCDTFLWCSFKFVSHSYSSRLLFHISSWHCPVCIQGPLYSMACQTNDDQQTHPDKGWRRSRLWSLREEVANKRKWYNGYSGSRFANRMRYSWRWWARDERMKWEKINYINNVVYKYKVIWRNLVGSLHLLCSLFS